jgi:hypothetical protein
MVWIGIGFDLQRIDKDEKVHLTVFSFTNKLALISNFVEIRCTALEMKNEAR